MPKRLRLPKTSPRFQSAERRANKSRGGLPKMRSTHFAELATKSKRETPGTRGYHEGRPKRATAPKGSPRQLAAERRMVLPKTDIKSEIKAQQKHVAKIRVASAAREGKRAIHKRQTTVLRTKRLAGSGPVDFTPGSGIRPPTAKELKGILAMNKKANAKTSKKRKGS